VKRSTQVALMSAHVAFAAGTYVLSKLATDGFPSSEALTLARALGTAFLLLALTGTAIPKPDFDGRTWGVLFLLGIVCVPVNQYLFLRGLRASVPSHSALLYALTPLGVLLASSLLERRMPPRAVTLGVLVALGGAIVVLKPWARDVATAEIRHGDLLLLLAVVAWVIYTIAIRGLCRRHDPRAVTAWSLILGALAMMPFGGQALKSMAWSTIPVAAWWGLVWLVVITSVTMMLLWSSLLRHLHPVQVAICMNAQPPATALLQTLLSWLGFWSWLGLAHVEEPLGAAFFAGMALVLLGAVIVQRGGAPVAVPVTSTPE
jgi:drug/metabolite transporter (DMT)-like permease